MARFIAVILLAIAFIFGLAPPTVSGATLSKSQESGVPPLRIAQAVEADALDSEIPHVPDVEAKSPPAKAEAQATPVEPPEGKETPPPIEPEEPAAAAPPLSESEEWAQRLERLVEGWDEHEKGPEDADALYLELTPVLKERRDKLHEVLSWARSPDAVVDFEAQLQQREAAEPQEKTEAQPPSEEPITDEESALPPEEPITEKKLELDTVEDLYATVTALYETRIQLLRYVSPELRAKVTGAGLAGVWELKEEIRQLILDFRFQALLVPQQVASWPEILNRAPLPVIGRILEITLALIIFRFWRGWVPGRLERAQVRLIEARPRRRRNLRFARMIWYVERVRSPLEWLALLTVLFSAVNVPGLQGLEKAPWSITRWVLLAWFAVDVIDALAARGSAGLSGRTAGLRLRSLRLVAAWIVVPGLGLDLAQAYAGRGTIYAWVWLLFEVLTVPVLLLLLAWWRSEIFRELESEPQLPAWVQGALQHRSGFRSFLSAATSGCYLIALRLQQQMLQAVSGLEWGRRFQARLYQHELVREMARLQAVGGEPISKDLRSRLLTDDGKFVDKVGRSVVARLSELVERGKGGVAAVVAERGGGKSLLLQRLASRFASDAVVFDCPPGGFEAFREAFAQGLNMDGHEPSCQAFSKRLEGTNARVVAIDNFHRIIRPVKDGQQDMDRVSEFIRHIQANVFWVVALDRAAWQYISRARVGRRIVLEELHMPPWSEEQIGELIELRCRNAGIHPNFGQLILLHRHDETGQETLTERNRLGFYRLLWHAADGNPAVALRLWADSLLVTADGEFIVRHPPHPETEELDRLSMPNLLVLRVIAQSELVAPDDIVESLRFSKAEVEIAIGRSLQNGWIEDVDGRYRLTWTSYRTITTVLARKNLLIRRPRGGPL
jgi:hypothetical protein